jgi:hypothetical protein
MCASGSVQEDGAQSVSRPVSLPMSRPVSRPVSLPMSRPVSLPVSLPEETRLLLCETSAGVALASLRAPIAAPRARRRMQITCRKRGSAAGRVGRGAQSGSCWAQSGWVQQGAAGCSSAGLRVGGRQDRERSASVHVHVRVSVSACRCM